MVLACAVYQLRPQKKDNGASLSLIDLAVEDAFAQGLLEVEVHVILVV